MARHLIYLLEHWILPICLPLCSVRIITNKNERFSFQCNAHNSHFCHKTATILCEVVTKIGRNQLKYVEALFCIFVSCWNSSSYRISRILNSRRLQTLLICLNIISVEIIIRFKSRFQILTKYSHIRKNSCETGAASSAYLRGDSLHQLCIAVLGRLVYANTKICWAGR